MVEMVEMVETGDLSPRLENPLSLSVTFLGASLDINHCSVVRADISKLGEKSAQDWNSNQVHLDCFITGKGDKNYATPRSLLLTYLSSPLSC